MSADWFFIKKSYFCGSKIIGPLSESDFLDKVESGEIKQETKISSMTRTHGHWILLSEINSSLDRFFRHKRKKND